MVTRIRKCNRQGELSFGSVNFERLFKMLRYPQTQMLLMEFEMFIAGRNVPPRNEPVLQDCRQHILKLLVELKKHFIC